MLWMQMRFIFKGRVAKETEASQEELSFRGNFGENGAGGVSADKTQVELCLSGAFMFRDLNACDTQDKDTRLLDVSPIFGD